jgi:hypothetical protein
VGGFNPSPTKAGAERGHLEEVLLESLLEADGTALAKGSTSFVWAEHVAESRAVAYLWHTLGRFTNQWDPDRVTDFLSRWETILGLRPLPSDSENARRAKVQAKRALFGVPPTQQVVSDLLTTVLGGLFAGLVHTSSALAVGAVPGGATVPGGVTLPDGDWTSSIAHVDVLLVEPATVDDPTFYAAAGQLGAYLDDLLPAWVTWDWVRDGPGGPGFYLDDDHNLDNERFD